MFIEFIINLKQFYPFPESPLKSSPVYSFLVAMVHPCYRKQTLYWFWTNIIILVSFIWYLSSSFGGALMSLVCMVRVHIRFDVVTEFEKSTEMDEFYWSSGSIAHFLAT